MTYHGGNMKMLIGVLMDMLRNVELSCWSVSDPSSEILVREEIPKKGVYDA
jgi:hypothetical protein